MKTYRFFLIILSGMLTLNMSAQDAHWDFNPYAFQYDMALYFNATIYGEPLDDWSAYEVAAFCGNECRGVAKTQNVGEIQYGYIRIRSNEMSDEQIVLKAYSRQANKEYECLDTIVFHAQDALGMPSNARTMDFVSLSPVKLTALSYSREYGDSNPVFSFETEGEDIHGNPEITCDATETTSVGTYPVFISKGSIANHNVTYVNGTLTITKAQLVVSVGNYSRMKYSENPEFELSYSGWKNGENESVLTTIPTAYTEATTESAIGEYDILVSGGEALNYYFTYINGKLNVTFPTEVKHLESKDPYSSNVYSVTGVNVRSYITLPHGIYIVNGRKIIK